MRLIMIFLLSFLSYISYATQEILTTEASSKIYHSGKFVNNLIYSDGDRSLFLTFKNDSLLKKQTLNNISLQNFEHDSSILALDISQDGKVILTGTSDGSAVLWSKTGEKLHTFQNQGKVKSVAISPNGNFILTASGENHLINLWKRERHGHLFWSTDWQLLQKKSYKYPIISVSFSPKRSDILLVTSTKYVSLHRIINDNIISLGQLEFPSEIITPAIFSPNSQKILIATKKEIYIYDVRHNQLKRKNIIREFSVSNAVSLAFSPDSQFFLVGLTNGEARLFSEKAEQEVITYKNPILKTPINHAAFSPNKRNILINQGFHTYIFNNNFGYSLFKFDTVPEEKGMLTFVEVSTMARLGVKIRYEDEKDLHPLSATDSPDKVIEAIELDLSNLYLDSLPIWLGKFKKLRFLNLSNNRLELQSLNILRGMTTLENIDLSNNPIFANLVVGAGELFKPLEDLLILNLESTNLKEIDLRTLGLPKGLFKLNIAKNRLKTLSFKGYSHLAEINAEGNQIQNLKLTDIPSLEKIILNNNRLSSLNFSDFPTRIREIDVANNVIRQVVFSRERDFPILEKIDLLGNRLSSLPDSMGDIFVLQNLKVLDVGNNIRKPAGLELKLKSFKKNADSSPQD